MDTKYTHESIPTKVTAARITDDVGTTVDALREAFGVVGPGVLLVDFDGGVVVRMQTIQGEAVQARAGEVVIQEADRSDRFYPCAGDVFAARYRAL